MNSNEASDDDTYAMDHAEAVAICLEDENIANFHSALLPVDQSDFETILAIAFWHGMTKANLDRLEAIEQFEKELIEREGH